MNLDKYELMKKIVDAVKTTKPSNIQVNDYQTSFELKFEWKEKEKDK